MDKEAYAITDNQSADQLQQARQLLFKTIDERQLTQFWLFGCSDSFRYWKILRDTLYEATKAQRPERWSRLSRNWEHEGIVFLNPSKSTEKEASSKEKQLRKSDIFLDNYRLR